MTVSNRNLIHILYGPWLIKGWSGPSPWLRKHWNHHLCIHFLAPGPHSLLSIDVALCRLNFIWLPGHMFPSVKVVGLVSRYIYIHQLISASSNLSILILFKQSSFKMHFTNFIALLAAPAIVAATLDPASSNTKGYKPSSLNCGGAWWQRRKNELSCADCHK